MSCQNRWRVLRPSTVILHFWSVILAPLCFTCNSALPFPLRSRVSDQTTYFWQVTITSLISMKSFRIFSLPTRISSHIPQALCHLHIWERHQLSDWVWGMLKVRHMAHAGLPSAHKILFPSFLCAEECDMGAMPRNTTWGRCSMVQKRISKYITACKQLHT